VGIVEIQEMLHPGSKAWWVEVTHVEIVGFPWRAIVRPGLVGKLAQMASMEGMSQDK
jgi:hypothetical protein